MIVVGIADCVHLRAMAAGTEGVHAAFLPGGGGAVHTVVCICLSVQIIDVDYIAFFFSNKQTTKTVF